MPDFKRVIPWKIWYISSALSHGKYVTFQVQYHMYGNGRYVAFKVRYPMENIWRIASALPHWKYVYIYISSNYRVLSREVCYISSTLYHRKYVILQVRYPIKMLHSNCVSHREYVIFQVRYHMDNMLYFKYYPSIIEYYHWKYVTV